MKQIEEIIQLTADHFSVTVEQLKQRPYTPGAKKKDLSIARQAAMYLIKQNSNLRDFQITEIFYRDRTIIYDAIESIENLLFSDYKFKVFYEELCEKVKSLIEGDKIKASYTWEK